MALSDRALKAQTHVVIAVAQLLSRRSSAQPLPQQRKTLADLVCCGTHNTGKPVTLWLIFRRAGRQVGEPRQNSRCRVERVAMAISSRQGDTKERKQGRAGGLGCGWGERRAQEREGAGREREWERGRQREIGCCSSCTLFLIIILLIVVLLIIVLLLLRSFSLGAEWRE